MISELFKLYPPLKDSFMGNDDLMFIDFIGGCMICVSFLTAGILLMVFAGKYPAKGGLKEQKIVAKGFGVAMIFCGIARCFTELSLWYNYAEIHAYIKVIAGIFGVISVLYTPVVLKKLKEAKTIDDLAKQLEVAKNKLEEVHDFNKRLDNNDSTSS